MSTFDPASYWEDRLRKNPNLQGVGFGGLGKNYNEWLYKVRRKVFLRIVRSMNINLGSAAVFDVGSGTGFYVQLWKEMGVQSIVGIDLTEVAVTHLRKKFPGDKFFRHDIGEQLPVDHVGKYCIVSAFDVFFHIVDDIRFERAIENIYALLAPGGWLIFSDFFLHHKAERAMHQVSRPLETVASILKRSGFHIIGRKPMFVLMNNPIDTIGRLYRFLWRLTLYPVRKSEFLGYILGSILYPSELILTALLKESPSTEFMICRKA